MPRTSFFAILPVLAVAIGPMAPLAAQGTGVPDAPRNTMLSTYLADIDTLHSKFFQLAGAMADDQYTWQPMEGVRTVAEVFMLIAAENYYVPSGWNAAPPDGIEITPAMFTAMSEISDPAAVREHVQKSFEYYRAAVAAISPDELHVRRSFFGQEMDTFQVLYLISSDQHEHLGQAIAYARMNRVVPPWSR